MEAVAIATDPLAAAEAARAGDVGSVPAAGSIDRTVFDWCRSINGQVWVSDGGHVTRLQLVQMPLADDDLARLKGLKKLVYLNLGRSEITDAALEHVRDLPSLDSVLITGTRISGPGLKALAGLPSLRILAIGGPLVTDATLEQLPPLENLRNLLVTDSQVTDKGLDHLRHLPGLRVLNLSGSQIGDASIEILEQLGGGKLEFLDLEKTKITAEGAARLRTAIPDCEIHR